MHIKLKTISDILGKKIKGMLAFSLAAGVALFSLEYLFIYSLQLFLMTIGFVDIDKIEKFDWFPTDKEKALLLFLTVGVLRSLVMMCKAYLGGAITQIFLSRQRKKILSFALLKLEKTSSYEVTSMFTDKINRAGAVLRVLSTVLMTSTSSLCLLGAGFYLAPKEMSLGIISFAIVLFPMKFLNQKLLDSGDGISSAWDKTLRFLMEGIKYNKFFMVHNLSLLQVDKGHDQLNKYEAHYKKYFLFAALKNGFPNFIGIFIVVVIVHFSMFSFNTAPSKLIAFLYIFMRLAHALSEMNAAINDFRLNSNLLKDYFEWYEKHSNDIEQKAETSHNLSLPPDSKVFISLDNISKSFEQLNVIKNLYLDLKTGDILLIKGESGTGKSTLLNLILGFILPDSGKIKIKSDSSDSIRVGDIVSYVGPEPVLFEGTIKNNILFGNKRAKSIQDAEIMNVLSTVQLKKHILSLKNGIHENLSETAEFSTGQKQRLSLARAILNNPRILILDEATANLDHDTENKIVSELEKITKNKITIIVSHKKTFDRMASQTINLPL